MAKRARRTYKCECCGKEFNSAKPDHAEHLCSDCIEIRRYLRRYVKESPH